MKLKILFGIVALTLALSTALAQDSPSLTKKEAKKLLKQSEKDLEGAKKAGVGVDEATRKHEDTLLKVLGRVPEQAKPGIRRAIARSKKGRKAASVALQRRQPSRRLTTPRRSIPRRRPN